MAVVDEIIVPRCPSCKGTEFQDFRGREKALCLGCRTVERNRVARLFLDKHVKPQKGWRVLHCAPERGLYRYLKGICGDTYQPVDFDVERYSKRFPDIRKFDLCHDAKTLAPESYDLIIHNHVLEHVPCSWACVLLNLHRALKPGGIHLFSMPIKPGFYAEDMNPALSTDERKVKFGQHDHLRAFGLKDFDQTIGAVFPEITSRYDLRQYFTEQELLGAAVPERWWRCSGASVFLVRKGAQPSGPAL